VVKCQRKLQNLLKVYVGEKPWIFNSLTNSERHRSAREQPEMFIRYQLSLFHVQSTFPNHSIFNVLFFCLGILFVTYYFTVKVSLEWANSYWLQTRCFYIFSCLDPDKQICYIYCHLFSLHVCLLLFHF
jgi:hypothetical protein